jgi:hypothetical protein
MGFSASSGFWPSSSWIQGCWNPYVEACQKIGVEPMSQERFYNSTLRGKAMSGQTSEAQAESTKLRGLSGMSGTM